MNRYMRHTGFMIIFLAISKPLWGAAAAKPHESGISRNFQGLSEVLFHLVTPPKHSNSDKVDAYNSYFSALLGQPECPFIEMVETKNILKLQEIAVKRGEIIKQLRDEKYYEQLMPYYVHSIHIWEAGVKLACNDKKLTTQQIIESIETYEYAITFFPHRSAILPDKNN